MTKSRVCKLASFACLLMLTGSLYVDSVQAELLAFYDFNDASDAAVAVDITGNGNDGEVVGAEYTALGGGRTGGGSDRAMDFLEDNDGSVVIVPTAEDGAFESIVEKDQASILMWTFGGPDQPTNHITFHFGTGEGGDGSVRQLQAHIPWSNGQIYFDVAGCCGGNQRINALEADDSLYKDEWNHYAFIKNEDYTAIYQNGELWLDSDAAGGPKDPVLDIVTFFIGAGPEEDGGGRSYHGLLDDFGVWDEALSEEQIVDVMMNGISTDTNPRLQAGDSNQDLQFNQLDLVQVQIAAKYLSGQAATWAKATGMAHREASKGRRLPAMASSISWTSSPRSATAST